MSGAEGAVEGAILSALEADDAVRAALGHPLRIRDEGSERPAFPFLEWVRQESRPAGCAGVEASEHRIDLGVVTRMGAEAEGREALDAVRAALTRESVVMEGWRCVLLFPVYCDYVRTKEKGRRGLLRIRVVVEKI